MRKSAVLVVLPLLAAAAPAVDGPISPSEAAVLEGEPVPPAVNEAAAIEAEDPDTFGDGEVVPEVAQAEDRPFFGDLGWAMILAWALLLGIPLLATLGLFAFGKNRRDEFGGNE